jgi:hypothetical protein
MSRLASGISMHFLYHNNILLVICKIPSTSPTPPRQINPEPIPTSQNPRQSHQRPIKREKRHLTTSSIGMMLDKYTRVENMAQ